ERVNVPGTVVGPTGTGRRVAYQLGGDVDHLPPYRVGVTAGCPRRRIVSIYDRAIILSRVPPTGRTASAPVHPPGGVRRARPLCSRATVWRARPLDSRGTVRRVRP